MLILSLSSIPPRFQHLGPTLESLLAQDAKPDAIELWIPRAYHRFPDWDGALPSVPAGVQIRRCDKDLGPATKVLPAARAAPGADLLFCDDDRVYAPDWGRRLCEARRDCPKGAICARGMMVHWKLGGSPVAPVPRAKPRPDWRKWLDRRLRPRAAERLFTRSGHVDMFEGCGGVLVRSEMFAPEDAEIPDLARPVDDVWLSGMLARRGVPIWLSADIASPVRSAAHGAAPLDGRDRHAQNIAAIRHLQDEFGIWQQ